jgi:hypothetical protein
MYLSSNPITAPFAGVVSKKGRQGKTPGHGADGRPTLLKETNDMQNMLMAIIPTLTKAVQNSAPGKAAGKAGEELAKLHYEDTYKGNTPEAVATKVAGDTKKYGYRSNVKPQGPVNINKKPVQGKKTWKRRRRR